jgi:hypothetical protein
MIANHKGTTRGHSTMGYSSTFHSLVDQYLKFFFFSITKNYSMSSLSMMESDKGESMVQRLLDMIARK